MGRRRGGRRLRFTKMHGLGNDFVMLDLISQRVSLQPAHIRKIADRHCGIGCDQVLVVEPPINHSSDFRYRIFNTDGSEAEQCGNGARCFARFVRDKQLTRKRVITVDTIGGPIILRIRDNHQVEVDMGPPRFDPSEIPLTAGQRQPSYTLTLAQDHEHEVREVEIGAVNMGNPHAVIKVDDVATAAVTELGPAVQQHPHLPEAANVGFMQVVSDNEINLRVYERGVGETLACGSGSCAAVAYGIARGWLAQNVTVNLPGGKLTISWQGEGNGVLMTGPTTTVFEGSIQL